MDDDNLQWLFEESYGEPDYSTQNGVDRVEMDDDYELNEED